MADALAAMCAPLETTDVVRAADKLTAHIRPTFVIDDLLQQGLDLMKARQVVEALSALRDAHVTDSGAAGWLLATEAGGDMDARGLSAATERVCQKLWDRLSRLVSPAGSQGILSRAVHVAGAEFPFLEGVRTGTAPELCLEGLAERTRDIEPGEARRGLAAVLGIMLDLLVGCIGEDLTVRLVREVWPDLPWRAPQRPGNSDGQEAAS
jgi:hypothetical protein